MVVTQGVVDQYELAPGGGDLADVLAAAGGDLVADAADVTGRGQALDRFNRRPADQAAALLGDLPRRTTASDSSWRGVSPAPQVNLSAAGNRLMSPISATNSG